MLRSIPRGPGPVLKDPPLSGELGDGIRRAARPLALPAAAGGETILDFTLMQFYTRPLVAVSTGTAYSIADGEVVDQCSTIKSFSFLVE